jgi:outer membrane protein TolC
MEGHRLRDPVRCLALALIFVCGCTPLWSLVVPEQRSLDIRDYSELPQAPLPTMAPPETVSTPPTPNATPKQLSLDEAIRIGLANSNVIRVLVGVTAVASGQTIYDPAISNTDIDVARSVFDPAFFVNNNWTRTELPQGFLAPKTPLGAFIAGSRDDNYGLDLGLSQRNILGGTAKLEYTDNLSRFHPGIFPLNPQDQTALTLSYTQSLLKGAGIGPNTAPIVIARINTELSYFQLKDSVQELVRGVIEAYWNVVFAREDVKARSDQERTLKEDYDREKGRFDKGFSTDGEVAQRRVALYNSRATLIASEANLLQREAALRNILGLPPPTDQDRFQLTTEPTTRRIEPKWDEITRLAEVRRPDLIELKLILEADQQSVLIANNQARPQVDATMFYRWNGLEGRTPSGVSIETGPGQFTDWNLGVNFSVPLGLRKDRAGLRRAELIVKRDEANLDQGLHAALHTLAGNVRNLAQFYEQYQTYKETEAAARINLEQQKALVRTGKAIFLVELQAITDLANAASAKAQALVQYNTELANLERQTGTILDTHGVKFFEERFRAIGPLGRWGPTRDYPASVLPSPNVERYQTPEPALAPQK